MIFVANKKRKPERILKDYPGAKIFDITSSAPTIQGRKLSPFYPHGNIPIPGESKGMTATCVEAIWQGLKIFEGNGIDVAMFKNDTMHNIKRSVRKYGKPLGHQFGVYSTTILNYADARKLIYVPTYRYVLDNVPSVHYLVEQLAERSKTEDIVLLDYNINPDNRDITKPLSHAELVKMYIENRYPEKEEDFKPMTQDELNAYNQKQKQNHNKRSTVRKRVDSIEDEISLINRLCELLNVGEFSANELCGLLMVDFDGRSLKKYLYKISKLKSRKKMGTNYYTLMEQGADSTLF